MATVVGPEIRLDCPASCPEACRVGLPPDIYMHTPLCRHARGELEEYARHALAIGLTEIGFSDHSPMIRSAACSAIFYNSPRASASKWITCPIKKTGDDAVIIG